MTRTLGRSERTSTATLLALAGPVAVENLAGFLVGLADAAILGNIGAAALAGMGAASTLFALAGAVGFALMTGGVVIVARAVGRGDHENCADAGGAVMAGFALGGLLILLVYFPVASFWIGLMGLEPDARAEGLAFFRVYAWVPLLTFLAPASRVILLGYGRTRRTLLLSLLHHGLHLATLPLFVYGAWGMPGMSAAGVAMASLAAGAVTSAAGVCLLRSERVRIRRALTGNVRLQLRELWSVGAPSAGEIFLYSVSQSMVMRITAILGTSFVAARFLMSRLFALSIAVQAALGQASLIHTGQETERSGAAGAWTGVRSALRIAVTAALLTAALFLVTPDSVIAFFSSDPVAVAWTAALLPLSLLMLLPQALNIVIGGALRGAGSTRWMLLTQSAGLVIVVVACGLFVFPMKLGLLGVFLGVALDEFVRAGWNYSRLRRTIGGRSAGKITPERAPFRPTA